MRDFAGTLYSDVHDRVPLGLRRRKCCGRCLSSARTAIDNVMSANGTSNSQEASETARVAWPLQLSHSIPFRSCLPVQLEAVGSVAVRGLLGQVLWQVDDHDRVKGALLQYQQQQHDRRGTSS